MRCGSEQKGRVVVGFSSFSGSAVLRAALVAGVATLLAGCSGDGRFPAGSRHYVPISAQMEALMSERGMNARSPILFRAYKKESELEVWKQDSAGDYRLLKTFPMCRWSGQLGPKKVEGDRQVPEGFYSITPAQLNPNSAYYLSFNLGYPNAYDRQLGRSGSNIMVHGACASMGCFSMTDEQVADIYALAREAFGGGQKAIQFQSYPFRMNAHNLARYRADENMPFWKNLKEGSDYFEVSRREPGVAVCNARYAFGADACGGAKDGALAARVAEKAREDEQKVAGLAAQTHAVTRIYKDGDQHPVFRQSTHTATTVSADPSRPVDGVDATSGIPRLVSRPDALDLAGVEVPQEKARGLSRAQLIVRAEQFRSGESVTLAAQESSKTSAPGAKPLLTTQPLAAPLPAARAFAAQPKRKEPDNPLVRTNGALGDLAASSSEASGEAMAPYQIPTPQPRR